MLLYFYQRRLHTLVFGYCFHMLPSIHICNIAIAFIDIARLTSFDIWLESCSKYIITNRAFGVRSVGKSAI